MEFIKTISLGEAIVGIGTIILAIVTVIITAWHIREDRRRWQRDVDRQYKRKLLDELESWIQSVIIALNKGWFCAKRWSKDFEEQDYFDENAELLEELLNLSSPGFFLSQKGRNPFEQYELKEKFEKLMDKYSDCTDMLHDLVGPPSEIGGDEELDREIELLNMATEFYRYLIEIREKEKI